MLRRSLCGDIRVVLSDSNGASGLSRRSLWGLDGRRLRVTAGTASEETEPSTIASTRLPMRALCSLVSVVGATWLEDRRP